MVVVVVMVVIVVVVVVVGSSGGGSVRDSPSNGGSCIRLRSPKQCVKKRPLTPPFSRFMKKN